MSQDLGVPGRLLLADGENISRQSARSCFGKENIQTTHFLLWMSATEGSGLCSDRQQVPAWCRPDLLFKSYE